MKLSKRLLSVLMALIMMFSVVAVSSVSASASTDFPVYDASKPSLVIGTVYCTEVGNVVVPIKIENNPGIWGMNFQVKYDSNLAYVEPDSGKNLNDGCDVLTGFCKVSNNASDRILTVYIENNSNEFSNSTNNGTVLNLTFKSNYPVRSAFPVSFTYVDRYGFIDKDCKDVELTFKNGGVICVVSKPATPKMNTVKYVASGTNRVYWYAAKNAKSYKVYRKVNSGSWTSLGSTTKTYFDDKKATTGGTYYYKVAAVNGTQTSSYSSEKYIKLVGVKTTPKMKSVSYVASGTNRVYWYAVTNAKSYKVYRKINSGKWTSLGSTTKTYFDDKKATTGGTYYYRIVAVNGTETTAYSSYKYIKVMGVANKPVISATAGKKYLKVTVKTKVTNATGYKYEYSLYSNMKSKKTSSSATIKGLKSGKYYYVRSRAYVKVGSKVYYSKYSSVVKVKVK